LEIALERSPKPKIASEVTMAGSDPATAVAKVSEKVAEVAPKRSQTEGDLPISPH
jgi:hypothetical protein